MRINSHYNNFVSVVIISYDPTSLHVQKTVNVLLKQTFKNFELILVDSGKEKLSSKVVEDILHDKSIPYRIVSLSQKRGARFNYARAYNTGIRHAQGSIIVRLSGDAIPVGARWLQYAVDLMQLEHVGIVSGVDIIQNQLTLDTYLLSALYDRARNIGFQLKKRSVLKNMPITNGPCMIFWKSIWQAHKFNEDWHWGEEIEFAASAMRKGFYLLYDPKIRILHSHRLDTREALHRIASDLLFVYRANGIFQQQFLRASQSFLKTTLEVPFAQIEKGRQYYIQNGSRKVMNTYIHQLAKFTSALLKDSS